MKNFLPKPYIFPLPVIYQVRGKRPQRHLDNRIHIHQVRYLSQQPKEGTPRLTCRTRYQRDTRWKATPKPF